jgi:hypothetical protein
MVKRKRITNLLQLAAEVAVQLGAESQTAVVAAAVLAVEAAAVGLGQLQGQQGLQPLAPQEFPEHRSCIRPRQ